MMLIFILGLLITTFFSSYLVLNKNASYKQLVSEKYLLSVFKTKLDEESVYLKNKKLNLTFILDIFEKIKQTSMNQFDAHLAFIHNPKRH